MNANPHDKNLPLSRLPRWIQWLGVAIFLIMLVCGALYMIGEHWRRATFLWGADMVWLGCLRIVCDARMLGVLSVRSRKFDIMFTWLVGILLMYTAYSIDSLGS